MSESEAKAKPETKPADHEPAWSPDPLARVTPPKQARRVAPVLITLLVVAVATGLGWATWDAYMGAPWTRDGAVRAYVVTMAPEVAGRIVELPVRDNQFVHKGDLLMVIEPTDYTIAVNQAEAAVQQAEASVKNIDAQLDVQQSQINSSQGQLDRAQAALVFAKQQAGRYGTLAQEGWGTVQEAQQYNSQLHEQEAAVRTASDNLNLVQR
ncbi:MAG: HlyD family secretion protein, partial [Hyphomicrobiales bacterium]|nr:HlyD family secretion protein [Hyphomicrobiales bacterium]